MASQKLGRRWLLMAACCFQVLTGLAACSVVVTMGGVSAAAASTVLALSSPLWLLLWHLLWHRLLL